MNLSSLPIFNFQMNRNQGSENNERVPRPTSQAVIDSINRVNVTDGRQCSICFEAMAENCMKLPCEHTFHEDCITQWLHRHSTCPMCRSPVSEDDEFEDSTTEQDTTQGINFVHRIQLQTILAPPTRKNIHFIFMFLNGFQIDTVWESSSLAYELLIFTKRFTNDGNVKIMFNMGQTQFSFSMLDTLNTLSVSLQELMIPNHCIMRVYLA